MENWEQYVEQPSVASDSSGDNWEQYVEQPITQTPEEPPAWAAEHPNLYGVYGAGKELIRTGIESGYTTLGAAGGAAIPLPGTSLVGAGVGYATGKRVASSLLDKEPVNMEPTNIVKDIALGAALQGGANVLGKIPIVKNIVSPEITAVGPERTIGSDAMDKMAYSMMEKSMKIPPSGKIGSQFINRDRVINTALDEGTLITKGGLNKAKGIRRNITAKMDEAISQSATKGKPVNTDDVLAPVDELRNFLEQTVNGKKLAGQIDDIIKGFKDQFGDVITVEQAQAIKQNTNVLLKKSYGELKSVETETTKQIVRGLKDRIAQEIPEITGLNAKYGDIKSLEIALERAVNRTGNWDWFSLSAGMAGSVVGGATGSVMKATEAVGMWRLLKSPRVQSGIAIALKRIGMGNKANLLANTITQSVFNKITGRDKALTGATGSY